MENIPHLGGSVRGRVKSARLQAMLKVPSTEGLTQDTAPFQHVATAAGKNHQLGPFPGFTQTVKNLLPMQETQVQSLGWEDLMEKGMTTHASILAWTQLCRDTAVGVRNGEEA